MGIINWMQNRLHGKTDNRSFDGAAAVSSSRGAGVYETQGVTYESSEKHLNAEQWPQGGLLSIGTLGNDEPPPAQQEEDLPEFTVEEVKKLQDALARILRRARSKSSARGSGAGEDRPPLDRFLNCPSCLEVDRRVVQTTKHGDGDGHSGDLSPDTKIILTRARDLLDNSSGSGSIKQKSFKFLLKKMLVCNGGFSAPARSLKDPVESRMEKFFRTILGKKMNAGSGNGTASSRKKYLLEDGTKEKRRGGRRRCGCEDEEREESCRWDRTDSEFIVLEI
ncbi:hypothetical protein SEVIR_9G375300v4 [Setaria viridis]|uniref:Uncharacterized protein n=2 Tax=Setaria TaxID=4554 RepID=A0A368SPM7_SETIT|nr:uncharacterized protein LOC101771763 [Setaria italica]XP_034576890.1 uncharacterized protein LOC117840492 isoform X2 [Setaria viridis]RCV44387.1 hypothetical protein SETIT_9G369600v2 [Setaria italica]TKV95622.1 hypothetical protein SEVIR_9G375300v2 [Setaria viridis]